MERGNHALACVEMPLKSVERIFSVERNIHVLRSSEGQKVAHHLQAVIRLQAAGALCAAGTVGLCFLCRLRKGNPQIRYEYL